MEIPTVKSSPRLSTSSAPGRVRALGTAVLAGLLAASGAHAQQAITGDYLQDFDGIGAGIPAGWTVRTGASATSLGSSTALNTAKVLWASTTGQFANYASDNIENPTPPDPTAQNDDTDRALGVRQTGAFGDSGASFDFNFSTINTTVSAFSLDVMTLSAQTRTTTWTIQYGIGSNPTTFTTLGTYDSGDFGGTVKAFTDADFGTALDNQSSIWFRVVALTPSTGSGSRDTFAIDNFSLTVAFIPPPEITWTGTGGGATWADGALGHFASNYANSLSNSVLFSGSGETVTTSGTLQAGGLTFTASNSALYTVTGTGFTLGAVGITANTNAVISAPIAGASGLTKAGAGDLTLSGTNTFTGNINIAEGRLIVSADTNLGDVANDIVLNGGTFSPTTSLSLAAGRDLSGTGTLEIGNADTLTVNGVLNATALTLPNAGTLVLAGTANSLGGLTMNDAATISITGGALSMSGSITTTNTTGTATISGTGMSLGSGSRLVTVADGSADTDLLISAGISSTGSGRLQKRGEGTLELSGDNSSLIGIQLGAQGAVPADGGRILIHAGTALGSGQLQANIGTLESTASFTRGAGVSIGGRSTGFPTFTGSDMTFNSTTVSTANSFFKATGSVDGEMRFNVNNTTTFSGNFAATSGAGGASTGITVGGTGKLVINGDASVISEKWTTQDTVTFELGSLGKVGAGGIEIASGSTLIIDITSLVDFGSSTGFLTMDDGGKLVLNLDNAIPGSWTLFAGADGTYTDISLSGSGFGVVALTDNGDGTWSGVSGDATFSYDTESATFIASVPEPQTYALIAVGLLLIAFTTMRRNSKNLRGQS